MPAIGCLSSHRVSDYEPRSSRGHRGELQVHLDLLIDDLSEACAAVEAAGGRPLTDALDPGPKVWRIYADPVGHPFCLVTVPRMTPPFLVVTLGDRAVGLRGEGLGLLPGEESVFAVGLDGSLFEGGTWASRSSIVVAEMVIRPV